MRVQKNDNLATWVRTGKIRWLPGKNLSSATYLFVCRTEMLLVMFLSLGERRGHAFGKISQLFRICFQNIHELQIKNYNMQLSC
jgi:hypothetical protein